MSTVKIEPCAGCGQLILAGRVIGFDTRIDPYVLTHRGCAQALLDGRDIYNIDPTRPTAIRCWPVTRDHITPLIVASHQHECVPAHIDPGVTEQLLKGLVPINVRYGFGPPPY